MTEPAIRLERALFGETHDGHGLIATSLDQGSAPSELAGLVDRPPGSYFPGVRWSPFIACGPVREWWAIWQTTEDPGASRSGMVRSRAVLLRKADAQRVQDIRPVIQDLARQQDADAVQPLVLGTSRAADVNSISVSRLLRLVDLLLDPSQSHPVVFPDKGDFAEVLASLWAGLWPSARGNIRCVFALGPEALPRRDVAPIIVTPQECAARWREFAVVEQEPLPQVQTAASQFITGSPTPEMAAIRERVGDLPQEIRAASWLERAARARSALAGATANFAAARDLQIWCAKLAPEPAVGQELKLEVVTQLRRGIETATLAEIGTLSNVRWDAYLGVPVDVTGAIADRVRDAVCEARGRDIALLLVRAANTQYQSWWREAIASGLRAAATSPHFPDAAWSCWTQVPESCAWIVSYVEEVPGLDVRLASAAPEPIAGELGAVIASEAARRRMPLLHAVATAAAHPAREALRQHVAAVAATEQSVWEIARRTSPAGFLEAAVESDRPEILGAAARIVAQDPSLLNGFDPSNSGWRRIWTLVTKEAHVPVRSEIIEVVTGRAIQAVCEGAAFEGPVAEILAHEGAVQPILRSPRRAELWPRIPTPAQNLLARRVATAFVRDFATLASEGRPESPLAEATLVEWRASSRGLTADALLLAIQVWPELRDDDVARRITRDTKGNAAAFLRLGQVVCQRSWRSTAKSISAQVRSGHTELIPALEGCQHLLRWIDRLFTTTRETSWEEWRNAFFEVACHLYGRGPSEKGLWERAGGTDAELEWNAAGEDRWRAALRRVLEGSTGASERELLDRMTDDNPRNEDLRALRQWFYQHAHRD